MLLLVATAGLVACDDGSESIFSAEGESCTKTADCKSGLKCVKLICQQGVTNDTLSAVGESCSSTADCESGLRCVAMTCVEELPLEEDVVMSEVGESCTKTADCESGLICVNLVCQQAGTYCPEDKNCDGLECGLDPVCGVSCGGCGGGETCQAGQCVGAPCEPNCSGKECGSDGCEGSCGSCHCGENCQSGACVFNACDGKECGSDGCGGSCGTCPAGTGCDGAHCVLVGSTWTDPTSGLTWRNPPAGDQMAWEDAEQYCSDLELDGGGWHLPTIGELRSLIRGCSDTEDGGSCNVEEGDCLALSCRHYLCSGCSSNDGPAGGMYWPDEVEGDCCWYWSSSPVEDSAGAWWAVAFHGGDVYFYGVDYNLRVRCVR